MNLEQIGQLAIAARQARLAFQAGIQKYNNTIFSRNPYSYEADRLAMLAAEKNLTTAIETFLADQNQEATA